MTANSLDGASPGYVVPFQANVCFYNFVLDELQTTNRAPSVRVLKGCLVSLSGISFFGKVRQQIIHARARLLQVAAVAGRTIRLKEEQDNTGNTAVQIRLD
jgi:hypothetical protein